MCGIIGILGKGDKTALLLMQSLQRLEYRGYDSAGLAMLHDGVLHRRRAKGKIAKLQGVLDLSPITGNVGIGHTRWATHGAVNESNAHPHMTEQVAIVHNGIIENYDELLELQLVNQLSLQSETDSEIIAHLLDSAYSRSGDASAAMAEVVPLLKGTFAFVALFRDCPDNLYGARFGSPLAVGFGDSGELFFGSDALAVSHMARSVSYLHDGDWASLSVGSGGDVRCVVTDFRGDEVMREQIAVTAEESIIAKGDYAHYMLKEIYEQPSSIGYCLGSLLDHETRSFRAIDLGIDFGILRRIFLVACGSSYYASMVGKYWIEELSGLLVQAEVASEFRYSSAPICDRDLGIFLSQSGETMDSLSALRHAGSFGAKILSIANVAGSSIIRESDSHILTHAGPEIGVASTKAFTAQLVVLAAVSLLLGVKHGRVNNEILGRSLESLIEVPSMMNRFFLEVDNIMKISSSVIASSRGVIYLGRGSLFPIALEGALKLKEVTYIHAEGYAAGEMKHGPIALIDESLPVIILAPSGRLFDKMLSTIREVSARGGRIIVISDSVGLERISNVCDVAGMIEVPVCDNFVAPILYSLPVQLLAYYTGLAEGTNIDQPRNLAKSVTVE